MAFDVLGLLRKLWAKKTQEVLSEVNLLLRLLQDAGYEVNQLEVELGVPPTVTIDLETGGGVSPDKLDTILRDNRDKKVLAAILTALIQASKLRDAVKVETLGLKDVRIALTVSPKITLRWKEKSASA